MPFSKRLEETVEEVKIERRSVFLPRLDKAQALKKAAMKFFECELIPEKKLGDVPCALADLGSYSARQVAALGERLHQVQHILVRPDLVAAGIPGIPTEKLVESRPLRGWAMASKMREFQVSAAAGDLCSLRLFWEWPKRLAGAPKAFRDLLLPDLLDLAEHMTGAEIRELHVEPIGSGHAAFVTAILAGNVDLSDGVGLDDAAGLLGGLLGGKK